MKRETTKLETNSRNCTRPPWLENSGQTEQSKRHIRRRRGKRRSMQNSKHLSQTCTVGKLYCRRRGTTWETVTCQTQRTDISTGGGVRIPKNPTEIAVSEFHLAVLVIFQNYERVITLCGYQCDSERNHISESSTHITVIFTISDRHLSASEIARFRCDPDPISRLPDHTSFRITRKAASRHTFTLTRNTTPRAGPAIHQRTTSQPKSRRGVHGRGSHAALA
jgi:hypothetical protein